MVTALLVIFTVIFLTDLYFFYATKSLIEHWKYAWLIKVGFWSTSVILAGSFVAAMVMYRNGIHISATLRAILQGLVFVLFIPRLFAIGVFFIDDIIRLVKMLFGGPIQGGTGGGISRMKFLQLSGLGLFALFSGIFTYGIFRGAYNFQLKRKKLVLPNLPKAFEGFKIIQISDLHLGSFFTQKPMEEAIKLINEQEADLVMFTGDLVNDISEEALPFVPLLKTMKAKEGVLSILGNHDYGDYFYSKEDPNFHQLRMHNRDLMKQIHADSGFKLLLDDVHHVERGGEKIAILGVENWGAKGRFAKYGRLDHAYGRVEKVPVKLLMSHDPSHWEAQVLPEYKDIDVTFSGHTHGLQFGIEIPGIKWSPIKYLYKQWAGLYEKQGQKLYVNRGLGFVGYPGRVGISPEISVFELSRS